MVIRKHRITKKVSKVSKPKTVSTRRTNRTRRYRDFRLAKPKVVYSKLENIAALLILGGTDIKPSEISFHDRELIKPYELDIVIKKKQFNATIAIEVQDLKTHKDEGFCNLKKMLCEWKGIRYVELWQIDEDTMAFRKEDIQYLKDTIKQTQEDIDETFKLIKEYHH